MNSSLPLSVMEEFTEGSAVHSSYQRSTSMKVKDSQEGSFCSTCLLEAFCNTELHVLKEFPSSSTV